MSKAKQPTVQPQTANSQPDAEQFRQEMRDLIAPRLVGHKPQVCAYMHRLIDVMTKAYATGGLDAVLQGLEWLGEAMRRDERQPQEQEESR
jgi:hypothetical protein